MSLRVPAQACFGKHVVLKKKNHIFGTLHMATGGGVGNLPRGRSVLAMGGNNRPDATEDRRDGRVNLKIH